MTNYLFYIFAFADVLYSRGHNLPTFFLKMHYSILVLLFIYYNFIFKN